MHHHLRRAQCIQLFQERVGSQEETIHWGYKETVYKSFQLTLGVSKQRVYLLMDANLCFVPLNLYSLSSSYFYTMSLCTLSPSLRPQLQGRTGSHLLSALQCLKHQVTPSLCDPFPPRAHITTTLPLQN